MLTLFYRLEGKNWQQRNNDYVMSQKQFLYKILVNSRKPAKFGANMISGARMQ